MFFYILLLLPLNFSETLSQPETEACNEETDHPQKEAEGDNDTHNDEVDTTQVRVIAHVWVHGMFFLFVFCFFIVRNGVKSALLFA